MWLVLCDSTDTAGMWAYLGLKRRGLDPMEVVLAEELSFGATYVHRVSSADTEAAIRLRDGRTIRSDRLSGVLNRLTHIPQGYLEQVRAEDRDYVAQELHAFFMSWLFSLPCPVLNPPGALCLAGEWRDTSEWLWLAAGAGLAVPVHRLNTHGRADAADGAAGLMEMASPGIPLDFRVVLVIGGEVVATGAPIAVVEGCRRMAMLAELPLLEIDFRIGPDGSWLCLGASPVPDLRLGGAAALDALARALGA